MLTLPADIVARVRPLGQEPNENRSGFDRGVHASIATPTGVTRDRASVADAASPQQRFRAQIARPDRALIACSRSLDKPCQYGRAPCLDRSRRIAHRFANQDRERSGSRRNDRTDPVGPLRHSPSLTRRAFKTARPARGALAPRDNIQTISSSFFPSTEERRSGQVTLHGGTLAQGLTSARRRTMATISNRQGTGKRMVGRGQCGPAGPAFRTRRKSQGPVAPSGRLRWRASYPIPWNATVQ